MASTNDSENPADGIELRTPAQGDGVDKGFPIRDGLFMLTNKWRERFSTLICITDSADELNANRLLPSKPDNGAHVAGWNHEDGSLNQQWRLVEDTPCDYTTYLEVLEGGLEIRASIQKWKPDLLPRLLLTHGEDAEYFVPPGVLVRRSLWEKANLQRQPVRSHLFDYDLFAIKSKAEVHSWAKDGFPVEV
ncbi:hypothetical protein M407DRAFT_7675 [Tulasnella calospora MUT 4182]|uniref:Agglutinin C-terminal domain-containing protein n=1 Tax=Tulasnella calospora MUT 4182 TaxID=1051891 RepID=A0A0C3QIJ2_9AGAM|nr:hypothetical protein M407DRAFT_7675 [Tulasnella calospora MUT 4182]